MSDALQRLIERQASKYFGKYRGSVIDNEDPLTRGRMKIRVPQVLGEAEVWALPCVPYAGPDEGLYTIPPNGAAVWIEFEAGDPSYPIWTGCFWGQRDLASLRVSPAIKLLKTRKFTLRIDDDKDEVSIENSAGNQIVISPLEIVIKANTIKQDANGRSTEISAVSFNVNQGALEVM